MTTYKCNHTSEIIILDNNELSLMKYYLWKDTKGFDGDKSLCFECYCEEKK